jgi:hypothetical protein
MVLQMKICDSLSITFSAKTPFMAPSPNPTRYKWDFGNGQTSTLANPTSKQVYNTPGTYKVSLKITQFDYFIDSVIILNAGSGWGDVCDISCSGTGPDLFITVPSLGFSNIANEISNKCSGRWGGLNLRLPAGTAAFTMNVWDDDDFPCGADDDLGNNTIIVSPNFLSIKTSILSKCFWIC